MAERGSQDPKNPFADVSLEEGDFGDLEGDMSLNDDNDFTDKDTLLSGEENGNAARSSGGNMAPQGNESSSRPKGLCSCFTVQYYQPYFDVDTSTVRKRVLRSLTAMQPSSRDFLTITQNNADLYGPFWIITTLVFVIGATSNFSSYLGFVKSAANPRWYYDFTLMTGAAGLCYGFGFGVPVGMWGMAKYLNIPLSLIQAVCLYGYSHSVYIIVAVLCMIPSNLIGWLAISVAAFLSCTFVGLNLQEHFKSAGVSKSVSSSLLGSVALVQVAFCTVLKLYFFRSIGNVVAFENGNQTLA